MAKSRPMMSFAQMESKSGYKIDNSNYPNDTTTRFYSSLRLVPDSNYERTVEEVDAYSSNIPRAHSGGMAAVPAIGDVGTIAHGDDIVRLTHRSHIVYGFAADIKYSFGVNLPFLPTKDEAVKFLSVARLRRSSIPSISPFEPFLKAISAQKPLTGAGMVFLVHIALLVRKLSVDIAFKMSSRLTAAS